MQAHLDEGNSNDVKYLVISMFLSGEARKQLMKCKNTRQYMVMQNARER